MKPGESKVVFGVVNASGNVFIDSFQNTQKLAQDTYTSSMGRQSWEQCVVETGVACRPFRLTIESIQ